MFLRRMIFFSSFYPFAYLSLSGLAIGLLVAGVIWLSVLLKYFIPNGPMSFAQELKLSHPLSGFGSITPIFCVTSRAVVGTIWF